MERFKAFHFHFQATGNNNNLRREPDRNLKSSFIRANVKNVIGTKKVARWSWSQITCNSKQLVGNIECMIRTRNVFRHMYYAARFLWNENYGEWICKKSIFHLSRKCHHCIKNFQYDVYMCLSVWRRNLCENVDS